MIEEQEWSMHFDGLSTFQGGGIGVVLKSPGEEHMFTYKLRFHALIMKQSMKPC